MTSDTILAFKTFAYHFQKKKEIKLHILHTQPVDNNGTDLPSGCSRNYVLI